VDLAAIFTGMAAILTAAGGMILVIREFRRRDRNACQEDLDQLGEDLHLLRQDYAHFQRWAYLLRQQALEAGVDTSDPPEPRPLAPLDPDGLRRGSPVARRLKRSHHGDGGTGDEPGAGGRS
jgi:hypothetical protein